MTLILTAICKDGISICADRRYKIVDDKGLIKFEDDHNKIYKFKTISFIILNHGINKIKNKDWRDCCVEYEESNRWVGKDQFQITNDFRSYIENDVLDELNTHKDGSKHLIGFLLCGKTGLDSKFKVNEISWLMESNVVLPDLRRHRFFIQTGDGKECLEKYITVHPEINTDRYWKTLKLNQAEKELVKLFLEAVKEKPNLKNDDFSDSFDQDSLSN